MEDATLNEIIDLSRACFAHITALERELLDEKRRLNRPGHIQAIREHLTRVLILQARVDAWAKRREREHV